MDDQLGERVDNGSERLGLSRRALVQRGAALAAALTVAPIVIDSLLVPAAAATNDFPWSRSTPGSYSVGVPCSGRKLTFDISGAGGAGGSAQVGFGSNGSRGGHGGAGTKIVGEIPVRPGNCSGYYSLNIVVGGKGQNADAVGTSLSAGSGDTPGGRGADGPDDAGAGGGGGGASSLTYSTLIDVVAPGGGGGAGSGDRTSNNARGGDGGALTGGNLSNGGTDLERRRRVSGF